MTKSLEQHRAAVNNLAAARTNIAELTGKITNHVLQVHPDKLECRICRPWYAQESAIQNRINALEKVIAEPIDQK